MSMAAKIYRHACDIQHQTCQLSCIWRETHTHTHRLRPGSQYDVRHNARLGFVPIKIKFMEHIGAWLLGSSCSDVLLATQKEKPSLFLRFYDTSLCCVVLTSYCEPGFTVLMHFHQHFHHAS